MSVKHLFSGHFVQVMAEAVVEGLSVLTFSGTTGSCAIGFLSLLKVRLGSNQTIHRLRRDIARRSGQMVAR